MSLEEIKLNLKLTISHLQEERTRAEANLKKVESPNFASALLEIINSSNELTVSQAAGIYFKNLIMRQWHLSDSDSILNANEREKIKQVIVSVFFRSPPLVSSILRAAIQEICKKDFPQNWISLIPELVQKLSSSNFEDLKGCLSLLETISERYLFKGRTPKTDRELAYLDSTLVPPLTQFFSRSVMSFSPNKEPEKFFELFVLVLESLLCLISQELLSQVEKDSKIWMEGFIKILEADCGEKLINNNSTYWGEKHLASKTAVLKLLTIFSEKYDDCSNYETYQNKFVELVLAILSKTNEEKKFDNLVIEGTKYIKSAAAKPSNKNLIRIVSKTLFEKIVFPNIFIRNSDVEEFKYQSMDYFRKDMENCFIKTRRKIAFELIQTLNALYEEEVSRIIMEYVSFLNKEYIQNPTENWTKKDAALFLIVSICVKTKTERQGVVRVSPNFDLKTFLANTVLSELSSVQGNPILKADCIKLLISFRSHIESKDFAGILRLMGSFLGSQSVALNAYAAHAIERFFVLKNKDNNFILNLGDITELSYELLKKLFKIHENNELFGNEFVMKAIAVIVKREGTRFQSYFEEVLSLMIKILSNTVKSETNAEFNHYVFESIAAFTAAMCAECPSRLSSFEVKLFPFFERILSSDEFSDFYTYVFQLLSQMLRYKPEVNSLYQKLFPLILTPKMWIEMENVRPLTTLLVELIRKTNANTEAYIEALLGLFQKLLSQKANDYHAFSILLTLVNNLPMKIIEKYLPQVIRLICIKLEKDRSLKFHSRFTSFYCSLIALAGFEVVFNSTETVQKGMTKMLFGKIILPSTENLSNSNQQKQASLGISSTLSSPLYLTTFGPADFCSLLKKAIEIIELPPLFKNEAAEQLEDLERSGANGQHSELIFARITEHDPIQKCGDPRAFLAKGLRSLSSKFPKKVGKIIEESLSGNQKKVLLSYLKDSGVVLE